MLRTNGAIIPPPRPVSEGTTVASVRFESAREYPRLNEVWPKRLMKK